MAEEIFKGRIGLNFGFMMSGNSGGYRCSNEFYDYLHFFPDCIIYIEPIFYN